jgi:hypothetical protein
VFNLASTGEVEDQTSVGLTFAGNNRLPGILQAISLVAFMTGRRVVGTDQPQADIVASFK